MNAPLIPGIYCIRCHSTVDLMTHFVSQWVEHRKHTEFLAQLPTIQSFLWISNQPKETLRTALRAPLNHVKAYKKNLNVFHVSASKPQEATEVLVEMIEQVCMIQPSLVVIENLNQWLKVSPKQANSHTVMTLIQRLSNWCFNNQLYFIVTIEDQLPIWCTFTQGLRNVGNNGQIELTQWWQTDWGYYSQLWHANPLNASNALIFELNHFKRLSQLAYHLYHARQNTTSDQILSVACDQTIPVQPSLLILLGADLIVFNNTPAPNRIPTTQTVYDPKHTHEAQSEKDFGLVFQETLSPGELKFQQPKHFSLIGTLVNQQAQQWGFTPSLSRVSLHSHISALQAAKLTEFYAPNCMCLATNEALYLFRLWHNPIDQPDLDALIEQFFKAPLRNLATGTVHYLNHDLIDSIFQSLATEKEAFNLDSLFDTMNEFEQQLDQVWHIQQDSHFERPWLNRLKVLCNTQRAFNPDSSHTHR